MVGINMPELAEDVLELCKVKGWETDWARRGCYLHLEASELIESLRGKSGEPLSEAADVLIVLMSITQQNNLNWDDVELKARETVDN